MTLLDVCMCVCPDDDVKTIVDICVLIGSYVDRSIGHKSQKSSHVKIACQGLISQRSRCFGTVMSYSVTGAETGICDGF